MHQARLINDPADLINRPQSTLTPVAQLAARYQDALIQPPTFTPVGVTEEPRHIYTPEEIAAAKHRNSLTPSPELIGFTVPSWQAPIVADETTTPEPTPAPSNRCPSVTPAGQVAGGPPTPQEQPAVKPTPWQDIDTATAATCGHPYPIQEAINDRGERVTRHDAYPDPDAGTFDLDARDLCHTCYVAKMDRRPMSFSHMAAAWRGR